MIPGPPSTLEKHTLQTPESLVTLTLCSHKIIVKALQPRDVRVHPDTAPDGVIDEHRAQRAEDPHDDERVHGRPGAEA